MKNFFKILIFFGIIILLVLGLFTFVNFIDKNGNTNETSLQQDKEGDLGAETLSLQQEIESAIKNSLNS